MLCFVSCVVVAERDHKNPNRFRLEDKSHEKPQIIFVALIINDLGAILFYSVSQISLVLECFALEVGNVRVHDLADLVEHNRALHADLRRRLAGKART